MVTMEDIANKCGVSKGTVSKALNGANDISESLRKKIIRTAVDMGYTRILSLDENKKVAVIIGTDKLLQPNHFGYQIIQSFQKEALINGYNVTIHNIHDIDSKENYDAFMLENKYHGSLFLSIDDKTQLRKLRICKTPTILLDQYVPYNDLLTSVSIDTLEGITKIVRYLHNQGHKKIGYLGSYTSSSIFQQRHHSFLIAMNLLKLPVEGQFGLEEKSLDCIQKHFMKIYNSGCTAIVCSHDSLAHSLMLYCKDLGISIPDDLSIVGIDDIEISAHSNPPLTTLRQDQHFLGQACFHALLNQLQGVGISRLVIHSQLIIRDSVKNLNKQ